MGAGMSARLLEAVIALTRAWLRVYTRRVPADVAAVRSAEIESDTWEMQHDPHMAAGLRRVWIAAERLLRGIPDDLAWHLENAALEEQLVVRRVFALTAATALVLSLWAVPSWFVKGRREVDSCAATATGLNSTAAMRHEVMRCAGAFFAARR
jgi:hypothetical protein